MLRFEIKVDINKLILSSEFYRPIQDDKDLYNASQLE